MKLEMKIYTLCGGGSGTKDEGRGTWGAGWGSQLAVIKTPVPIAAWNWHAYS